MKGIPKRVPQTAFQRLMTGRGKSYGEKKGCFQSFLSNVLIFLLIFSNLSYMSSSLCFSLTIPFTSFVRLLWTVSWFLAVYWHRTVFVLSVLLKDLERFVLQYQCTVPGYPDSANWWSVSAVITHSTYRIILMSMVGYLYCSWVLWRIRSYDFILRYPIKSSRDYYFCMFIILAGNIWIPAFLFLICINLLWNVQFFSTCSYSYTFLVSGGTP